MSDARPSNTAALSPDALPSNNEAATSPARTLVLSESQLFYTPPNIPLKGTADNLMVINWVLDTSQSVARGLFILTLGDWLFDFDSGLSGFSWKIGDAARLARYPYWFTAVMWLWSFAPLVGFTRALLAVQRNIPGARFLAAYQTMAGLSPGMPLALEAAITTQTVLTTMIYWLRNPTSSIISQCAILAALWIIYKARDRYARPQKNMLNLWPEDLSIWYAIEGLALLVSVSIYLVVSGSSPGSQAGVLSDRLATALGWLGAFCIKQFLRSLQTEVMNTDWLIDEVSKRHVERTKQAEEQGRAFGNGPEVEIAGP